MISDMFTTRRSVSDWRLSVSIFFRQDLLHSFGVCAQTHRSWAKEYEMKKSVMNDVCVWLAATKLELKLNLEAFLANFEFMKRKRCHNNKLKETEESESVSSSGAIISALNSVPNETVRKINHSCVISFTHRTFCSVASNWINYASLELMKKCYFKLFHECLPRKFLSWKAFQNFFR